jgi:2-acylglycerol O-acyltransferase 2
MGFGENDIFEQVPNERGTKVRAFQRQFQSIFGFTTPFFHGRGVFNYSFGILPHRRPVTVIGP